MRIRLQQPLGTKGCAVPDHHSSVSHCLMLLAQRRKECLPASRDHAPHETGSELGERKHAWANTKRPQNRSIRNSIGTLPDQLSTLLRCSAVNRVTLLRASCRRLRVASCHLHIHAADLQAVVEGKTLGGQAEGILAAAEHCGVV